MGPRSSSCPKPVPKSILKKKYSREVTLYAPDIEVVVVPDSSDEQEEEDDEDDEMNDEEDELDAPSSPSVPITPKKPKVVASAPSSSSSSRRRHPRSFRQRLSSSRLVAVPGPRPSSQSASLRTTKPRWSGQWTNWPSVSKSGGSFVATVPVDPVPPFILPTAAPPSITPGNPSFPHTLMLKSLGAPSFGSHRRATRPPAGNQYSAEGGRRRRKERIAAMEALEEFRTRCELEHPWRSGSRYAAQYETVKGQLDELVSRADQIHLSLDEVRHVHNLIRAVGHEGSLGEYLDLVMDLLHLDSPAMAWFTSRSHSAAPEDSRPPPQPVASSSKKRTRDGDDIPRPLPQQDLRRRSHMGIASTLEKKVGSERIVFAGGCERCGRMGPCFTTLSASSSDKGAQGRSCLPGLHLFSNDQRADPVGNSSNDEPAAKRRKEKPASVKEEPGVDRKGKGKARSRPPSGGGIRQRRWEPALTYGLDALTPNPGDRLDRIPSSLRRGRTMKFGFPPEECFDEERARRYAARTAATMQYFMYMHRSNAQLAGREFILRLVENLHPLRYRPPLSIGPTPSLHSDAYPVPVPELRGNVQWRALLHAYANELPILMHHARSELVEDDLERLATGVLRAGLHLCSSPPTSPRRLRTPLRRSTSRLCRAPSNLCPAGQRCARPHEPAPEHDSTWAPAPLRFYLLAIPRRSFRRSASLIRARPRRRLLSPTARRRRLEGLHVQPSVARSEAGDIIVNTGGRDESLSLALDSGPGILVERRPKKRIDGRGEGGRSFDALEQEREVSREGTVGAETAGRRWILGGSVGRAQRPPPKNFFIVRRSSGKRTLKIVCNC
ncbi:hypothetical protein B0H13DRAFT_1918597 [Mycena leptocephala]|nr:hypothetical protein B0H13DRAFT_1918597 [Mycena leptocephala]